MCTLPQAMKKQVSSIAVSVGFLTFCQQIQLFSANNFAIMLLFAIFAHKTNMMRNMKKILILTLLMLAGMTSMAATYDYFVIKQTDGTESKLTSEGLKITFADGKMTATSPESGTSTWSLSQLYSMRFSDVSTGGITDILASDGSPVTVFNLAGVVVAHGSSAEAAIEGLQPGIYIVKNNTRAIKVQVR